MKIAQVFVEHPIMHLDHTFTYACDGFSVQRGVRVQVPFGKPRLSALYAGGNDHGAAGCRIRLHHTSD